MRLWGVSGLHTVLPKHCVRYRQIRLGGQCGWGHTGRLAGKRMEYRTVGWHSDGYPVMLLDMLLFAHLGRRTEKSPKP